MAIVPLGVHAPDDFDAAFAEMTRKPPDAILMVSDVLTTLNRQRVIDFAAEHRLPAIYEYANLTRDGGLMSYGPDVGAIFDRAVGLADRILKGANPADLPLELPTRFELAINLKTAKTLDLAIPESIPGELGHLMEGGEGRIRLPIPGLSRAVPMVRRLRAGASRIRTCMGLFLSSGCFWLLAVLCSEREGPFFVPSPAIRFPERAEGVKGPKRLAQLGGLPLSGACVSQRLDA
jgi:hypothetical protein